MALVGRLLVYGLLVLIYLSTLISTSSGYCQQRVLSKGGDLRIVAVLGLSKSAGISCDGADHEAYQAALALSWTTDLLNGNWSNNSSYIPGISIGFDIYDDCGIEELALDAILRSESVQNLPCSYAQSSGLAQSTGFIVGPSEETLVAVSNFVRTEDVVLGLSPAVIETGGWGNILRLRPPIESQTEVTVELLQYFKWNYIGVVYTDDIYGRSSFQDFQEKTRNAGICISLHYMIPGSAADDTEFTRSVDAAMKEIRQSQFQAEDSHFAVVYFGDMRGVGSFLDILSTLPKCTLHCDDRHIHWVFPQEIGTKLEFQELLGQYGQIPNFIITVSPASSSIQDFQNYYVNALSQPTNTWLNDYALKYHECTPIPAAGTVCTEGNIVTNYKQATSVTAMTDSVFSIANVLKKYHERYCGADAGICEQMRTRVSEGLFSEIRQISLNYSDMFPESPASRSLGFDCDGFVDVDGKPMFEVYNVRTETNTFNSIGEFGRNGLLMKNSFQQPHAISRCKDQCPECTDMAENNFVYLHGEILLLGLFAIRSNVAGEFECGDYRNSKSSITTALAFIESVKHMKTQTGMNFGAIAFDDCFSALNSISFVNELFNGHKILLDPKSGTQINTSRIVVVVGALSSQVTLAVAELLTPLGIPMVSYGASASWLDDRDRYPYFLRTVPSDTLQVEAMLSVLKYFNFTYVGGVNINDAYGNTGIKDLQTKSQNSGICFQKQRSIDESNMESFDEATSRLKNLLVKVVVFFGLDTTAEIMLNKIKQEYKDGFVFLASEGWGHSTYLLEEGRGEACKGSIVLNVQTMDHADESFRTFLQTLTPADARTDPWTKQLWEDIMNCDFLESFSHKHDQVCSESDRLSREDIDQLYGDQRRVHTMYAVYAIGAGIEKTSKTIGDKDLTSYLRDNPRAFVIAIRESIISTADGKSFRPFKDDGNGNIGFVINNIQKNQGEFQYIEIGTFDEEKRLNIYNKVVNFYELDHVDVSCISKGTCTSLAACNPDTVTPQVTSPTQITEVDEGVSPYMSAVIALAVFTGILTVLIILMLLFFFRQEKTKAAILRNKTTSIASHLSTGTGNIYDEPRGSICTGLDNDTISLRNGILNSPSESGKSIQYSRLNPDGTVFLSMNSPSHSPTPCSPRSRKMVPIHLRNRSQSSLASSGVATPERSDNSRNLSQTPTRSPNITYLTAKDLDIDEEDGSNNDVDSVTSYTDMSLGSKRYATENSTYSFGTLPRQYSLDELRAENKKDWLPINSESLKKLNVHQKQFSSDNLTAGNRPDWLPLNPMALNMSDNLSNKQSNYLNSPSKKTSNELPVPLVPDVVMHERSADSNMTVFI